MKLSKNAKKLTEYIVFPLAFFLFGILFLYQVLSPLLSIAKSGWELFSFDVSTTFGEEIHKDIFSEGRLEGYSGNIPASKITFPRNGTKYGEITVTTGDSINVIPLYFGDSRSILRRGAGHYMGSRFPGESSTVLISAHNNTFFNCLQYVAVGDIIKIETNYGSYAYEVQLIEVHNNDSLPYDLNAEEETLILYTCYPFDELGLTANRYYVVSKLVSGPKILAEE